MSFNHDFTGVHEAGVYSPFPKGNYLLRIKDAQEKNTKNGDAMVRMTLKVEEGEHAGRLMWHSVSFLPTMTDGKPTPGAGFAKRWLHVIGEPYEGRITVRPESWVGKLFQAQVGIEPYTSNGQSREKNVIAELLGPEKDGEVRGAESREEVPF